MDIVSYRGPDAPGGVSNVLQTVFHDPRLEFDGWWYFARNRFKRLMSSLTPSSLTLASLSPDLFESHYRYCNQFLWPLFHGCPQYSEYDAKLRLAFRRTNRILAETLARTSFSDEFFVHDYQLALVPKLLASAGFDRVSFFWHIPWPAEIQEESLERITEIAAGIAGATRIGFQTREDADNFVSFCDTYLQMPSVERKTCVAPVAIDAELWSILAQDRLRSKQVTQRLGIRDDERIVLSVERADYTKGVLERLNAIDHFLETNAGCFEKLRFVQVLPRTREGVEVYDQYWTACASKIEEINNKWTKNGQAPVLWVQESLSGPELAALYARSDVMLVTSLADGLNLTAKEFIVSRQKRPGALVLSKECGVASELADAPFVVDPRSTEQISSAVRDALWASEAQLWQRHARARHSVVGNDPLNWISKMNLPTAGKQLAKVT